MGQYYLTVNLTKRQYLNPNAFDEGLKLMEHSRDKDGLATALIVLLSHGNGEGGGRFTRR